MTISGTRNGAEVATSKTNARGEFSFDELGAGHYDFKAEQRASLNPYFLSPSGRSVRCWSPRC